ncbi:MAG: hypothetical protein HQL27_08210 [Candidatus Omnitrophica bacterium]|nr:hypothetical protein [Candidatus Omnitrophota bacterium]
MSKSKHYTVWNKKKGKIVSAKYLKGSKGVSMPVPQCQNSSQMILAGKLSSSIKNAVMD